MKQSECSDEMEVNMQNKTNCENGTGQTIKTQTKTRKTHQQAKKKTEKHSKSKITLL